MLWSIENWVSISQSYDIVKHMRGSFHGLLFLKLQSPNLRWWVLTSSILKRLAWLLLLQRLDANLNTFVCCSCCIDDFMRAAFPDSQKNRRGSLPCLEQFIQQARHYRLYLQSIDSVLGTWNPLVQKHLCWIKRCITAFTHSLGYSCLHLKSLLEILWYYKIEILTLITT